MLNPFTPYSVQRMNVEVFGGGGGGGVAIYANAATCLDDHKFPIEAVIEAWKFCGINILHWVVCIEVYVNADCL